MAQTTLKQRQIAGGLDGWIPADKTSYYLLSKHYTGTTGTAIRLIDGGGRFEATCAYL